MSDMFKEMKFKQPDKFEFSRENQEKVKAAIEKYPEGQKQSAVMPLLDIAQRQHNNWVPRAAMDCIADILGMPRIKVYEIATFYTMYNKQPVGKNLLQVCRTTPCWLRGAEEISKACKSKLNIECGETTKDGKFTLVEVECLGACVNAPIVQINDDYYEDLSPASMEALIDALSAGQKPSMGSQIGRQCSAPIDAGAPEIALPTKLPTKKKVAAKVAQKKKAPAKKKKL